MSDSSSPLNCDIAGIVSKLKIFNEEAKKLQEKIENLYSEAGCTKKEIDKDIKEKIGNIKNKIIREKENLELEIQRNRPKNITAHKRNIKEAKQKLKELGESVSPDDSLLGATLTPSKKKGIMYNLDNIAKGTRKKRVKSSRKGQHKKTR